MLKPVDPERLKNSLSKVLNKKSISQQTERIQVLEALLKTGNSEKILIPYVGGIHVLKVVDIIIIKADGAYSRFILTDQEIIVSKNLSQIEKLLSNFNIFFRAHRSFILNLNHVEKYTSGELILSNQSKVKLSGEKARNLMRAIQ